MNKIGKQSSTSFQSGMALVTALIFLVVLTLLGISAMQLNFFEERMAGNSRDLNIALQAAEAALRDGEMDINKNITLSTPFDSICTNGLCTPPTVSTQWWKTLDWTDTAKTRAYGAYTSSTNLAYAKTQPKYIIEKLATLPIPAGQDITLGIKPPTAGIAYRITARGVGVQPETIVFLQSIYVIN